MKYMGSKARIAKEILPIMLTCREANQWWVEPFVGGGNMIARVTGNRIGSDANGFVIDALLSIRDYPNDLPSNNKEFSEKNYNDLRTNKFHHHKGYAGFALSYGGKWLGGWCRDAAGKRDYVAEAFRNAQKQSPKLQGVFFFHCGYQDLRIPPQSLIYCDPPYKGTTGYSNKFDHETFWEWCRTKAKEGHTVFISEYSAPEDFECVWEKEIVSSLTSNTGAKSGIEKLFKKI